MHSIIAQHFILNCTPIICITHTAANKKKNKRISHLRLTVCLTIIRTTSNVTAATSASPFLFLFFLVFTQPQFISTFTTNALLIRFPFLPLASIYRFVFFYFYLAISSYFSCCLNFIYQLLIILFMISCSLAQHWHWTKQKTHKQTNFAADGFIYPFNGKASSNRPFIRCFIRSRYRSVRKFTFNWF